MATAHLVKSALKDIYQRGRRVEYTSQKGKREGQTLSKIDRTLPHEEGDEILIHKGEPYYWWQFKNCNKSISKTAPRASQLTQSNFFSQYYCLQEQIEDLQDGITLEELSEFVESMKSDIDSIRDECQNSLDNMPESLQESDTGQLLQERIDEMDELESQFEDIDMDFNIDDCMDDIKQEIASDNGIDMDEEGWEDKLDEEDIEEKKSEKLEEFVSEKLEEVRNICFDL